MLLRIVVPIIVPALAVVAFFSFTLSWNEFLYADVFTTSVTVKTLPTGLAGFKQRDVFFWGPIMASSLISAVPPLLYVLRAAALAAHGVDHGSGARVTPAPLLATLNRRGSPMNRNDLTRRGFLKRGGAAIAAAAVGGAVPATPGRAAGAKLVFWQLPMFSPQADKLQKEQVYAYAKGARLQEADVEFVVVSEDTYIAKLTAAIEAGTLPDLVLVADSDAALFLGKGHLLDVTAVVDKMKKEPGGLNPAGLIPGTAGGRNYGVPVGINALPFHSRIDLLEKGKLEYPKTWDAFVEACKKVQKPPFYGYGMSLGKRRLRIQHPDRLLGVWRDGSRRQGRGGLQLEGQRQRVPAHRRHGEQAQDHPAGGAQLGFLRQQQGIHLRASRLRPERHERLVQHQPEKDKPELAARTAPSRPPTDRPARRTRS